MPGAGVVDVSAWEVVNPEPLGREAKIWLREPEAPDRSRERDWLFKPVVVPSSHGHPQGEDWAEKIVCELGELLGVPCADVEFAEWNGVIGSISRNVTPDGWNLQHGGYFLASLDPDYQEGQLKVRGRPGHSPATVMHALRECRSPLQYDGLSAPEVFAGYLVLDAWVANQDRHDQNWAVLQQAASGDLQLAPSFDHASSLGSGLLDERRQRLLDQPSGVAGWAEQGRAHRFEHDPDGGRAAMPSLVETALTGLALAGERASAYWLSQLEAIERPTLAALVTRMPRMSDVAGSFVVELLETNRGRLLRDR